MAKNVTVQVTGEEAKTFASGMNTVADVQKALGKEKYAATINGDPADSSAELEDFCFVTLAPQVKGA